MALNPNNAYIRQQIYLEGVKNYQAEKGKDVVAVVNGVVIPLISGAGVAALFELTKGQFTSLLTKIRLRLKPKLDRTQVQLINDLKTIFKADYAVSKNTVKAVAPEVQPEPTTFGKLWGKAEREPISGTGELPGATVAAYFSYVLSDTLRAVRKSYSNKDTIEETIRVFRGTKEKRFMDGLLGSYFKRYGAMSETVIQHLSSFVNSTLGRLVSKSYVWLSVLDANTTDICRGRNGNVYEYGKGPQPPAHYRCRSRTRPYFASYPTVPQSFFAWVVAQPAPVQNDIFGASVGGRIRSGDVKAGDMPKYESDLRLTPDQYKSKQNMITLTEKG